MEYYLLTYYTLIPQLINYKNVVLFQSYFIDMPIKYYYMNFTFNTLSLGTPMQFIMFHDVQTYFAFSNFYYMTYASSIILKEMPNVILTFIDSSSYISFFAAVCIVEICTLRFLNDIIF